MGYIPSIGEIVRIRQWDDMIQEFGTRGNRFDDDDRIVIPCKGTFVPEMKKFCGKEYEVARLKDILLGGYTRVFFTNGSTRPFVFSPDMLEPAENDEEIDPGNEIIDFLNLFREV